MTQFRVRSQLRRFRIGDEEGGSLVEMAMVLPVLLFTMTGIVTFGITMNSALELTNGVAVGAQYLGSGRLMITSDPCTATANVINAAAPLPASAGITYTIQIYSTSTTFVTSSTGTTPTCPTAALTQGQPIVITASAPCTVSVYGNTNILPGCKLPAQVTVISQ